MPLDLPLLINKLNGIGAGVFIMTNIRVDRFFNLSTNLLAVVDLEGTVLEINRTFLDILGCRYEDFVGQTFDKFTHPKDRFLMWEAIQKATLNKSSTKIENKLKVLGRGYVCVEWTFTFEEESNVLLAIGRDVTNQKKKEASLKQLNEKLSQKLKDFEQFGYIVSHNLRAPVANILGLVSLMKSHEEVPDETMEMIDSLTQVSERLDQVVKNLNEIIVSKENIKESKKLVFLDLEVKNSMELLNNEIKSSNAKIESDFSEVPKLRVFSSYLNSIFYNLIKNSISYRHPDREPVIQIKSNLEREHVRLTISDNGTGIVFGNENENGNENKNGNGEYIKFHPDSLSKGLGLNLVWQHVHSLGGEMYIKTHEGEGTTFKMVFGFEASLGLTRLAKVFLIDDDAVTNMIHQKLIEKSTPHVATTRFESPILALKTLFNMKEEEYPDLILLDINMDEMSGWEFLDRFGTFLDMSKNKIKVIILTSSIFEKDKIQAENYPLVYDFISKPLTGETWKNILPVPQQAVPIN